MILSSEIQAVGHFGKTHGVNGEINLMFDVEVLPEKLSCIILDMDGILVPFFLTSVRNRGLDSYLVFIDGISTEYDASKLVNKVVFALKKELPEDQGDEEGFYAEDLIGYNVILNDNAVKGVIRDIDDNTANILFIVDTDSGKQLLIPVAEEFIEAIDIVTKTITLALPEGLVDL